MKLVNLTPHPINLRPGSGGEIVVSPTGTLARCSSDRSVVGEIEIEGMKVPITQVVLGEISGLPEPEPDTMFIVSLVVASAAARFGRRDDILVPDDAIRDDAGHIVGCRALARQ